MSDATLKARAHLRNLVIFGWPFVRRGSWRALRRSATSALGPLHLRKGLLTEAEADKIRDADTPALRIKLYMGFADDRLKKFELRAASDRSGAAPRRNSERAAERIFRMRRRRGGSDRRGARKNSWTFATR